MNSQLICNRHRNDCVNQKKLQEYQQSSKALNKPKKNLENVLIDQIMKVLLTNLLRKIRKNIAPVIELIYWLAF